MTIKWTRKKVLNPSCCADKQEKEIVTAFTAKLALGFGSEAVV